MQQQKERKGQGTTGSVTFVHGAWEAADVPRRLPAITQCPLLTPDRSSLCRSPSGINRVAQQRSRALNSSGSTKPQQFPSGKTLERRWPFPSRSSCGDAPCPARACLPTETPGIQPCRMLWKNTPRRLTSCVKGMILLCQWRVFLCPCVHVSVCPYVRVRGCSQSACLPS